MLGTPNTRIVVAKIVPMPDMFRCGRFQLSLGRPQIMGIVNVTPDSFSDGGCYYAHERAIAHACQLIEDGADVLDIGGESTRPGATPVSEDEEMFRIVPVIEGLASEHIPLSIDTSKPAVMRAAIAAGADMINDVNALQHPEAMNMLQQTTSAICLMHRKGQPSTMQDAPEYNDVQAEVADFLHNRASAAVNAGIARERILIDPGFGFGKTLSQNLTLLKQLRTLRALGFPLLVGLSRKSMLGAITQRPVGERLAVSVAAAVLAIVQGAWMVRVHDVAATRDALKLCEAVRQ